MMDDQQLLRYSRHILLPEMDITGQQALISSHALIIGLGGLGSAVAMYLAASGVGQLTLVDFDTVDLSNLQRQVIHSEASIGENKASSAKSYIASINADISVTAIDQRLDEATLAEHIDNADVVLDCTDNFATRFTLNQLCFNAKTPLVSGAAIRFEGQLTVFDFRRIDSPCYQCLYSPDADESLSCSEAGVVSPLVGTVGSLQALETIKLLANIGESLVGRLIIFDAKRHQWRELKLSKDHQCQVCAS